VRILFLGDIVGEPGRRAIRQLVPRLRAELPADFVIANGENMAGGSGLTPRTADEVFSAGVDVLTSGDHVWDAEATSEKIALGRLLDGQVSAVVGTHTHVQTADEQIFPGGTAYLTDAGFTGAHESVLGRDIEPVIKRFLTNLPQKFTVAEHAVRLQGVLVEVDDSSGRARDVRRLSLPLPPETA
jgi:calcineurin-like phosphoesterase